jgi:hypothetical protein
MELSKKALALPTVFGIKDRVDTQPDYQRPAVWSINQKRLLIDTILRKYDIPKMYWRKTGKSPDTYEVVDGQQRLRAIWDFMSDAYHLGKDADPINGFNLKNLNYSTLPLDLRDVFDQYNLDIMIMLDTDEEEVREMFLRLQNGSTLKAQERRNAMSGAMRDFIKQISTHSFFSSCRHENVRYIYDSIAAQMTKIELAGQPCNIKNADINKMYNENKNFDSKGVKAKKIIKVLDFLYKCFPTKTPELEWYSVISLYMIASSLMEKYVLTTIESKIFQWFIDFESYRREEVKKDTENCDPEILIYNDFTGHSTDALESLKSRYEYLLRKLLEYIPDLQLKDNNRLFAHEQRLAIFRRDNGICQLKIKCDGIKCEWDNWEADHKEPWAHGGLTTVNNGQVACPECNKAKSDN